MSNWKRRYRKAMKRAAYWQQECGAQVEIIARIGPDARRWHEHLAACSKGGKVRAQAHRANVIAMTDRLQREGWGGD